MCISELVGMTDEDKQAVVEQLAKMLRVVPINIETKETE